MQLVRPAVNEETTRALGERDWRPSLNWIDVFELVDGPPQADPAAGRRGHLWRKIHGLSSLAVGATRKRMCQPPQFSTRMAARWAVGALAAPADEAGLGLRGGVA